MVSNSVFTVEKTEIGERESFSVRRTGSDFWDCSLPWDTLKDCISVLDAAISSPVPSVSQGFTYQVQNYAENYRTQTILQWKGVNGYEYCLKLPLDDVSSLVSVLTDLADFEGLSLDLDSSKLPSINPDSAFDVQLSGAAKNKSSEFYKSLSDDFVTSPLRPGASFELLPDLLTNTYRFNTAAYSQDNIVTLTDGTQYEVWLRNGDSHAMLSKRNVDTGSTRTTFDMRTVVPDVFGSQAGDGHNVFSIGVSSDGHIHVSGNHHDSVLRYMKSTEPGVVTSMAAGTMVGTEESSVTYPAFFNTADGTLFFAYRNGGSGNGNFMLNRYDAVTGTWVRVGAILVGLDSADSPYPNKFVPDTVNPQGIHIFFTWRGSGTASSNKNICYAYSPDGGVTWQKSTGAAQSVPITYANCEVVIAKPVGSGIMNQCGADADYLGHPHGAFTWYDDNGHSQYYHVWHDGTDWHTEQVSSFTERIETIAVGTVDLTVARPQIFCVGRHSYMIGRCKGIGQNGVILIDATPGSSHDPAVLVSGDFTEWEPAYDTQALRTRGEVRILVTDLSDPGEAWIDEPAGQLTLPVKEVSWALGSGSSFRKEDLKFASSPPIIGLKPGRITGVMDLNTLSTRSHDGIYLLQSTGTFTNVPSPMVYPAVLEVKWVTSLALQQTLWLTSQGGSWVRTLVSGAWSTWNQVAPRTGILAGGTDVATLLMGSYLLVTAPSSAYVNIPAAAAGVPSALEIILVAPGIRLLRITSLDRTKAWEATYQSSALSTWVQTRGA